MTTRSFAGFIWIFANSKHPDETIVVSDTMYSATLDPIESIDRQAGWLCIFSVLVDDVPSNLQALADALDLEQLDYQLDFAPVTVANALHKVVHGELAV